MRISIAPARSKGVNISDCKIQNQGFAAFSNLFKNGNSIFV